MRQINITIPITVNEFEEDNNGKISKMGLISPVHGTMRDNKGNEKGDISCGLSCNVEIHFYDEESNKLEETSYMLNPIDLWNALCKELVKDQLIKENREINFTDTEFN